jgi:hypothetical protein
MKQEVSREDFIRRFEESDGYRNSFSRLALHALFDYFEELEEDSGESIEFDMVAICCAYSEYKSAWEAMEQYQPEDMPTIDDEPNENGVGMDLVELGEAQEKAALEWLENTTTVISFDTGIIIQDF